MRAELFPIPPPPCAPVSALRVACIRRVGAKHRIDKPNLRPAIARMRAALVGLVRRPTPAFI